MQPKIIPATPGTYALLIGVTQETEINIGKLGLVELPAGRFIYIGSAHGPGGLAGRIHRHMRPASQKRLHWHIDWLLQEASLLQAWWVESESDLECTWARSLSLVCEHGFLGFGASDCNCASHLFFLCDQSQVQEAFQILAACQPDNLQDACPNQVQI